jgi:hypothetical protein
LASVEGITSTNVVDVSINKTNAPMFEHGVFGISVSEYTAGQNWLGILYTHIGRASPRVEIGRSAPIAGVSFLTIAIANAQTTTQHDFIGVPRVMEVGFAGTSFGVGITFSATVSASLLTHR